MGVTLTQSPDTGFIDRPRAADGVGLRAVLTLGGDGQAVEHRLTSAVNVLHVRFLIRRLSLAGGSIVLCQGSDDQAGETFQITLDDQNTLACRAEEVSVSASLTPENNAAWDCVEVGFDAVAGTATLWINGVQATQTTGLHPSFAVDQISFGIPRKSYAAVGEIHLDEWMLGGGYLGPVAVEPTSDHADDPARWLVIYNSADPDSTAWAQAYRQARRIPYANLLGLNLPLDETINLASYTALLDQIETYLDLNGLRPSVLGILLGYRVPGYVYNDELDQQHPVGSLLHTTATHLSAAGNPVSQSSPLARPTTANLAGVRLTARLDAPTLSEALALSERAEAFDAAPLTAADRLYFDPIPRRPSLEILSDQMMDWFDSLDRQRLRIDTQVSGDPVAEPDADFASVEHDAIYWGWASAVPPAGLFSDEGGPRAVCVQLREFGVDATTLRAAAPSHWIDHALAAGYAAATAASQSVSPSSLPKAPRFFEALRCGWTLAEAWLISQSFIRSGMYLVGDPLLTIHFPKAGWDVFGPLGRSEDLDPDQPLAVLPADADRFVLEPTQPPAEDASARYLVRRVDDQGRSEASFQPIRLGRQNTQPRAVPPAPAWPTRDHWPVQTQDSAAVAHLLLPAPASPLNLERLELLRDQDEPPVNVPFDRHARWVHSPIPATGHSIRVRWRLTAPGGLTHLTPWSAPFSHTSPPLIPLTTPEL